MRHHRLYSIVSTAVIALVGIQLGALAGDRKERRCSHELAVLKHEEKIIASKTENTETAFCLFVASLPPSMNGRSQAAIATEAVWEAAADFGPEKQKLLEAIAVPALVEFMAEQLKAPEFKDAGGWELSELLEANEESIYKCLASIAAGEEFHSKEPFELSCRSPIDDDRSFTILASYQNVLMFLHMPEA